MHNPVDCTLQFGTTHVEEIHAEARKEGRTAFLAPDFSCADYRKSAFSSALKGLVSYSLGWPPLFAWIAFRIPSKL